VAEKEEEEAMEETESTVDMPKLMAMKSDNSELAVHPSTPPIRPSRLLQFVSDYTNPSCSWPWAMGMEGRKYCNSFRFYIYICM
jgi:hypothetical protein